MKYGDENNYFYYLDNLCLLINMFKENLMELFTGFHLH